MVTALKNHQAGFQAAGSNPGIAFIFLHNYVHQAFELLSCILRQLVEDQPELPDDIQTEWSKYSERNTPLTLVGLFDLLKGVTKGRLVYIVVDAMDECLPAARAPFIEGLTSMGSEIGLLITSRFMGDFEQLFAGFGRINISANPDDIRDYVDHCISRNPRLTGFTKMDKTLRDDIKNKVIQKSGDM